MRDLCKSCTVLSGLVLVVVLVSGGCAGGGGPVPVQGVVTGKHQISPKGTPAERPGEETPRYFLWLKTDDGPAFVEVTEDVFHSVTEGDRVCINCESPGP